MTKPQATCDATGNLGYSSLALHLVTHTAHDLARHPSHEPQPEGDRERDEEQRHDDEQRQGGEFVGKHTPLHSSQPLPRRPVTRVRRVVAIALAALTLVELKGLAKGIVLRDVSAVDGCA